MSRNKKPHEDEDSNAPPRLIHRNLPYYQSANVLDINHHYGVGSNAKHGRRAIFRLWAHDWFHAMLRIPIPISLWTLLVLWTSIALFFAAMYYTLDHRNPEVDCGLSFHGTDDDSITFTSMTYGGAFAFAVETSTTVGYGLPGGTNGFFNNCPEIQVLIYVQIITSMMFNAFLFAFFFARLAKSENRAAQVVFGKQCVIRTEDDIDDCGKKKSRIVLQVRVYDVDARHPIVEAHVRIYAVLRATDKGSNRAGVGDELQHPQIVPLRIVFPNDELNATLLTSLPSIVTHEIDIHSPLCHHRGPRNPHRLTSGSLLLREVDSLTGNREGNICPVCGESYGSWERLRLHMKYNQLVETKNDVPKEGSHQAWNVDPTHHDDDDLGGGDGDDSENLHEPKSPTLQDVRNFFPLQELLVVVEGIDPLMSGTFQALQSYTPKDICWGGRFVPCLHSSPNLTSVVVDLEAFHGTEIVENSKLPTTTNGDVPPTTP